MAEQSNSRFSLRSALLAALPLIVIGLAIWTLAPDGPRGAQANSTPINPEAVSRVFEFTNNTGQQVTGLEITFSGTVEKPTVTTQPPGCDEDPLGPPDVTQPQNHIVAAFWSIKCINPLAGAGGTVMIKVFAKPGVEPTSWTWTNHGTPKPTITQTSVATTTPTISTPTASPSTTASPSATPETPTATPVTPTDTPITPTTTPVTPTNTPVTPTNTSPPTDTPPRPTSTYTNTPPSTSTPGTPVPKRCGDVNMDQNITSLDAALVLQFDAGLINSLTNTRNADVNADSAITSIDAVLILQFTAGLLSQLDCRPPG